MSKVTSISQVKDLYDLMDLFANRDTNADGRLGPDEISAEQISAGDRKGIGQDQPDGFLQPWEIMGMCSPSAFYPSEIEGMRHYNVSVAFPSTAFLSRDAEIGGMVYQKGTTLSLDVSTHYSRIKSGILARRKRLASTPPLVLPAKSSVFHKYEKGRARLSTATLGARITVDGVVYPKGTILDFDEKGALLTATHPGGRIVIRNARYRSLAFTAGAIESGELAQPAFLPMRRGRTLPFKGSVYFRPDGLVRKGTLGADVPSPYGAAYIHSAGSEVEFTKTGFLIEDTHECFQALFPKIALSGRVSRKELHAAIAAFLQVSPETIAAIKGLHFSTGELPTPFTRGKRHGYSNPFNHTIYILKDARDVGTITSDIIHEAAHMRHIALQKALMRQINIATVHLDPSDPYALAEEHAISTFIFSHGFDAQWSKAAGYDFQFSVADLTSYLRNFNAHSSIAASLIVDEPEKGFVNSYGKVSLWEDVATQVEFIHKNPEYYRELIDQDSQFYRTRSEQRPYAFVFRRKLDLLRQYAIITEEQYRKVVPLHTSVQSFCQTVNCP